MKIKNFIALFVCVILLAFAGILYADGEFGDDENPAEYNPDPSASPFIPPMPDEEDIEEIYEDEDEEVVVDDTEKKPALWNKKNPPEKYSNDTAKVIRSYGIKDTNGLINRHKDAAAGVGNKEKLERYEGIVRLYPMDYLAAYRAAECNFAMGRNSGALRWINKCLEIYPDYMPARRLKKQIQGALK